MKTDQVRADEVGTEDVGKDRQGQVQFHERSNQQLRFAKIFRTTMGRPDEAQVRQGPCLASAHSDSESVPASNLARTPSR